MGDGHVQEWTNRNQDYRSDITPFALAYLEENIAEVTIADVEAYSTALRNSPTKNKFGKVVGVSNATVNLRLAALKSLFKTAIREGYRTDNPAASDAVDRKKQRRNPKPFRLESDDIRKLLTYLNSLEKQTFVVQRNVMILKFLFLTGCRRDELVRLTTQDLQELKRGEGVAVSLIRKGDVKQNILLTNELEGDFVEYVNSFNPQRFLFPRADRNGTVTNMPMSPNRVTEIVTKLSKEVLGRQHSPHDFRHAFATTALEAGAPLHQVQQYLGHSDPKTTMLYYDSVLSREGSAAEFVSLKE
jgi:site-specific recombinase XerD